MQQTSKWFYICKVMNLNFNIFCNINKSYVLLDMIARVELDSKSSSLISELLFGLHGFPCEFC